MSEDLVKPSGMGGSEISRKLVGGWKEIMAQKTGQKPQQRVIKEQVEPKKEVETNYKPGSDEDSEGFSMRRAKQHMQKLTEQKRSEMVFKGNATQIALKLNILTEGVEANPDTGRSAVPGGKKVKILSCEDAGFGQYKLTYILED
jgi:hypothetical protein